MAAVSLFSDSLEPICPYTGLRTFTEEESIYFRGREAHAAKGLELLAREHFVMITGASGDGKSSLVFAGMLPEIRAGFFRALYSNWVVATFRPERTPLRNLALALAEALRLESSADAVENELRHGFSALVQLYQASTLCPPLLEAEASPDAHRQHRAQAANLLLVVDQFEEFFTNAENYEGASPSAAAQTVVNLLIETTRLAREQGLPIYILCTMRSDYVGQCAEFRGLIELIGESQYFVPRLLRQEFVEVIKEPALLSGNRISERLVQRLLYDIQDGLDQLPVLQHALHQIWLAADQGRQEMDLRHYAIVGGMAVAELPAADQTALQDWLASLSEQQHLLLQQRPSLRNILDAHANQLFQGAAADYNARHQPPLSEETAQRVLETTFRCLTRLDANRVVRNRMTGREITAILNEEQLSWPVIAQVLTPFRRAGNTFVYPFLAEGAEEAEVLPDDTVLDITHESLIRNWRRLTAWAHDEAQQVNVLQEAQSQASRWQQSKQSRGYLLPIGLFTYFSTWFARKKPSVGWLAHYIMREGSPDAREQQAREQLGLLEKFLLVSRKSLRVPLFIEQVGAGRLLAIAATVVVLAGATFMYQNWARKQNDRVLYAIASERLPTLTSTRISLDNKAKMVIALDRLKADIHTPLFSGSGSDTYSFTHVLDNLANDTLALDIELAMFGLTAANPHAVKASANPMNEHILDDIARRLGVTNLIPQAQQVTATERLLAPRIARFLMACTYYNHYNPSQRSKLEMLKKVSYDRLVSYVKRELAQTKTTRPNVVSLSYCIRVLLSRNPYNVERLRFLTSISPFQEATKPSFTHFFPADKEIHVTSQSGLRHSGGYHAYAYIATALGSETEINRSIDSVANYSYNLGYSDGANSLLPYLVKYQRINHKNIVGLIKKLSTATSTTFLQTYTFLCYQLIGLNPSRSILGYQFQWSSKAYPVGIDNNLSSFDETSANREALKDAILNSVEGINASTLVISDIQHVTQYREASHVVLQLFVDKLLGIYESVFTKNVPASVRHFNQFKSLYTRLTALVPAGVSIPIMDWTLAYTQSGIFKGDSEWMSGSTFLLGTRTPFTNSLSTYETCSYRSFWQTLLDSSFIHQNPKVRLVIDSTAYAEVIWPSEDGNDSHITLDKDKYSTSSYNSTPLDIPIDTILLGNWNKIADHTDKEFMKNALLFSLVKNSFSSSLQYQNEDSFKQLVADLKMALRTRNSILKTALYVASNNLAKNYIKYNQEDKAIRLANIFKPYRSTFMDVQIAEVLFLKNSRESSKGYKYKVVEYIEKLLSEQMRNEGADMPSNLLPLYQWNPGFPASIYQKFKFFGEFLTKESESRDKEIHTLINGRALNHDLYNAALAIPDYEPEDARQEYYSNLLTCAALSKTKPQDFYWNYYDFPIILSFYYGEFGMK